MRAIIIDDERLARAELKKLLQDFPEVEVIDEAANAEEGITKLKASTPILSSWISKCRAKPVLICCLNWKRSPHVIFTYSLR